MKKINFEDFHVGQYLRVHMNDGSIVYGKIRKIDEIYMYCDEYDSIDSEWLQDIGRISKECNPAIVQQLHISDEVQFKLIVS